MTLFLVHKKTGKKFQIVKHDKETKMVTLKGSHAQFEEPFDPARFKRQGYDLVKGTEDA